MELDPQDQALTIVDQLVTLQNVIVTLSIYALITTFRMVFTGAYYGKVIQRLVPLFPLILGVAGQLLITINQGVSIGDRVMVGLITGFAAAHLHELVGKNLPFLRDSEQK